MGSVAPCFPTCQQGSPCQDSGKMTVWNTEKSFVLILKNIIAKINFTPNSLNNLNHRTEELQKERFQKQGLRHFSAI